MTMFDWLFRRKFKPKGITLVVEPTETKESGPCECCGDHTRSLFGFLRRGDHAEAAYIVQWTLRKIARHGIHVDLIIGRWGEGTKRSDRMAVSLEYRQTETGPWFMVIDATKRDVSRSDLVGKALTREDVIDTPLAKRVFEMVDAVWLCDHRIHELA